MLICLDAGHGKYTPGKRCLKSIDPGETREWVLNSRIADKVQERLENYNCQTMRVDDPTGETDISLGTRVTQANQAGADVYVSIHHNAGINGGSGGGIVIYTCHNPQRQSAILQEAVYQHTVDATGLKGNRANPMSEANLYVLNNTKMPAILGEFGFMDSTHDTPIILTEDFATQVADGIVAALVDVYGLEEKEMSYETWKEYMDRYLSERAALSASDWAVPYISEAINKGYMADIGGTIERPQSFVTREELATVSVALTGK